MEIIVTPRGMNCISPAINFNYCNLFSSRCYLATKERKNR